jgi:hypothetical protein
MHSLSELLERCSRLAGEAFRRDGERRAYLWLTETMGGVQPWFDTPCWAPTEVSDAAALAALQAEMAVDFARDGVAAYAVAFVGWVTLTGIGCALLARPPTGRRRVVVVEAHDAHGSLVGTRDIEPGVWPRLGPLQRYAHAHARPRFSGLLAARGDSQLENASATARSSPAGGGGP